jgi:MYXO-CTERM domain-containing protein
MWHCPSCNETVEDGQETCEKCGTRRAGTVSSSTTPAKGDRPLWLGLIVLGGANETGPVLAS